MKVKTIRQHINSFGPVPIKNVGRKYEVEDRIGQALIGSGVVVEDVRLAVGDNGPEVVNPKATDATEG